MKDKTKKVAKYVYYYTVYGTYPMLLLLKHFEDQESFKECIYIMKASAVIEELLNVKLFKHINESDFNELTQVERTIFKSNFKTILSEL